jgi:hypothetical protein
MHRILIFICNLTIKLSEAITSSIEIVLTMAYNTELFGFGASSIVRNFKYSKTQKQKTNSVALSPQMNYTD